MPANALFRPTFADLRAEIERRVARGASSAEIDDLIGQFLLAGGAAPAPCLEYDGTVTWLYRESTGASVSVVGDILGYDPAGTRMSRLPGCDLLFLTASIPLDARLAYSFVLERGDASDRRAPPIVDPLNSRRMLATDPLRPLSILEMPNARPVPELEDGDGDEPNVLYQVIGSADGTTWARVWIYLPPDYDPADRRYPALYLLDGEAYLVSARAPRIMDALVAQGEVAPAIVVFVERPGGPSGGDAAYAQFLAQDLVPWIDARYPTSTDPQERAIGGAGTSGALSLYVALEHPDMFGRVLAQSPLGRSLVVHLPGLLARNAARGFGPPLCYIDVGRYDHPGRVEGAQSLCGALLGRGATVSYQDFGGDHSFLGWRATLPDALRFHFGVPPLAGL